MEIKPPVNLKIEEPGRPPRNETSRRKFFQQSREIAIGAAATLITLKTGHAAKALGEIEHLAEYLDPQESLAKKWEQAIAKGLIGLEQNQEFIQKFGQEKVTELARILKKFDINQYISSLANLAGIDNQDVNGELLSFIIKIREQGNQMAHVEDRRHIVLFIDEWALYKNSFHQETIHAVISHELTHILSFNYNDPTDYETPWRRSEDWPVGYAAGVSKYFYEGATEFVAIAPQLQLGGSKTLEQGYHGGGALSAFTIAELIGRDNFIKAYITHDPKLLIKALEEKIGKGASKNLLLQSEDSFFSNLDELDNIFHSQNRYQYVKNPQ